MKRKNKKEKDDIIAYSVLSDSFHVPPDYFQVYII